MGQQLYLVWAGLKGFWNKRLLGNDTSEILDAGKDSVGKRSSHSHSLFNRPGVAGAVLCGSLNNSVIFSSQSSIHCLSQTKNARKLKFSENVHPPPHISHITHIMCHVSHATCHVSCLKTFFSSFLTKWWS